MTPDGPSDETSDETTDETPRPAIRGRLVELRPQTADDQSLIHRWYQDPETAALMGELPTSLAARERRYAAGVERGADDYQLFMICRLSDGRPIGRIDLFEIDRVNGSAAFGIAIGDRSMRGQGYGSDAVSAIVDHCFDELRLERVWLITDEANRRAQAVYRAVGFSVEVVERNAFYQDGRLTNDIRMSILRGERVQRTPASRD
jgi:RimJ/RimL family protein N-acetyltransferase